LLTRARQLIDLAQQTRELITEIRFTQNQTRLEGMPLQTGRDMARLASTQAAQMGRSLVPGGLSQAPWVRSLLDQIRQLPVTLDQLRDRSREIGALVSSSIAALLRAPAAIAARSALSRFLGAAATVLEGLGSRLITIPFFIIIPTSMLRPGGAPQEA